MYPFSQTTGKRQLTPYLIVLPALVLFLAFQVLPSMATIVFSFTDITRTGYKEINFIGLENYLEFFRPETFRDKGIALKNSMIFTALVVVVQNGIALAVALMLNKKWRGRAFFRAAVFLPVLLGVTVNALVWRLMFNPYDGPVQTVVQSVYQPADYKVTYSSLRKLKAEEFPETVIDGLNALKNKKFTRESAFLKALEEQIGQVETSTYKDVILSHVKSPRRLLFFADPQMAFWLIIFLQIWIHMGYSCVIFLSGLQAIPMELYEAARVDGANKLAQFKHVTYPLIAQAVTVNVLLAVIGALRTFDVIYVTTNGQFDTQTLAFYVFGQAFAMAGSSGGGRFGFACAADTILFIFIFIAAFITQRYLRKREVEL